MAGVGSEAATANSESTKATHKNIQRIFNDEFRPSTAARQAHPVWAQLSESQACDFRLYDDFANFLAYEYLIKSSDPVRNHLAIGSVLDYLGALIQCAANRFKAAGSAQTRQFFTCQDTGSSTDSGQWLRGLKDKIFLARRAAQLERDRAFGCLMPDNASSAGPTVKLNPDAGMCYLEYMHGDRVEPKITKQDKGRLGRLAALFDSMANKEEKLKLLPSKGQRVQAPSGERRVIVDGLSELMRARYADAFGDAVPQSLQPGAKSLLTTAMENRDRELAKKGMPCISLEGMQAPPPTARKPSKSKKRRMGA